MFHQVSGGHYSALRDFRAKVEPNAILALFSELEEWRESAEYGWWAWADSNSRPRPYQRLSMTPSH